MCFTEHEIILITVLKTLTCRWLFTQQFLFLLVRIQLLFFFIPVLRVISRGLSLTSNNWRWWSHQLRSSTNYSNLLYISKVPKNTKKPVWKKKYVEIQGWNVSFQMTHPSEMIIKIKTYKPEISKRRNILKKTHQINFYYFITYQLKGKLMISLSLLPLDKKIELTSDLS